MVNLVSRALKYSKRRNFLSIRGRKGVVRRRACLYLSPLYMVPVHDIVK